MNSPFVFGKLAGERSFTNRERDKKRLANNFRNQVNTILISPRRWGKSSLVKQVSREVEKKNNRFCFLDLFDVRTEQEFYEAFAREVIKSTSSRFEDWINTAREFLSGFSPGISIGADPHTDFKITFHQQQEEISRDILDLPEQMAKKKKIKIVCCIDEFQNMEHYGDPMAFQKTLRSKWQHHQLVTYCIYGSKRHMMTSLFSKPSMPFYKFGDLFFLEKIPSDEFADFIVAQFASTRKKISLQFAELIVDTVQAHSYYTQQLAHLVWETTQKTVGKKTIEKGIEDIIDRNTPLFQLTFENLSSIQVNFLKALTDGISEKYTSKEILERYKMGTSASVLRAIDGLEKKETIDRFTGQIEFIDPVFSLWLKRLWNKC